MEAFTIIIGFVIVAFGILQIILFFKLWGMTNDVARIKEYMYMAMPTKSHDAKILKGQPNDSSHPDWVIGSRVVHVHSGNPMKITSLNSNGTFVCAKDGLIAGSYRRDELMTWSEWREHSEQ